MYKIEAYLFFNDNCAEAMRFYEAVLGGTLSLTTVKGSPAADEMPGSEDRILHARLEASGAVLIASDWMAASPYPARGGFSVTLTAPSLEESKALFDKLSDGGEVTMPFEKTFFSDGFGMLVDRFGVPWMVMASSE